ncbi:MAG: DUF1501 domain-containing protein [Pirellulaceae bacterium]
MLPKNQMFNQMAGELIRHQTRRHFLRDCQVGMGAIATSLLAGQHAQAGGVPTFEPTFGKAKNVIYLHMAGSPSQLELFDYKPELERLHMEPCPDSLLKEQKFAFIKGHPKILGPQAKFKQTGSNGQYFSDLIPNLGGIADDLTIVHSMVTDQFNHAPAQLYLHTGNARSGYPSLGSWATYGLGTENQDLPGYVVFVSGGNNPSAGKAVWGNGFLPGVYQGVQCRSVGDPILFLNNPPGMSRDSRRASLDALNQLNQMQSQEFGDPETQTRIEQYELAFRMQMAAPEAMDLSTETQETLESYGAAIGGSGFANNCLLARRLVERGVRFVELFDWGWDVHGTGAHDDLNTQFVKKCKEMDQPVAALISDLKQRGMLDETLVIWGGEFGRTSMNEARNGSTFLGRDHHPHCFTMFFAGGGMKSGFDFGQTDELGYFVTEDKMTVRDMQATVLHLLGLDPFQLSYPFQGLNARLIGPTDEGVIRKELFT